MQKGNVEIAVIIDPDQRGSRQMLAGVIKND